MSKKVQLGVKPSSQATQTATADAWVETRSSGEKEAIKRLTIDIPESLHRQIKATCAMNGTKIADEVRELLLQKYGG